MTDYTVNIKACLFELQESRETLPTTFAQLYQFHRQNSQIEVNPQNNDQLWQCFFEFCQSLKQVKKYYDQALMLIEQDELMQPICKDAINYLEQHYGRNSIHKVVYHSEDRNSVALALHKLISDVESWDVRTLCSKRSIVYTFFDLAEDAVDDFAGTTEKHYVLAQESEHSPSYFYDLWQCDRRTRLFRCAVQDEELRSLVVKYVKLIDERNMNLGSESDLRYFSDQAQLFEAPYIALLEASDEYIPDFIDSYSLTYRWYNHLPEIGLVDRLLTQHPQSSYLKYFYPATGHRMSGNSNYCPPFSDWYLSQLSDPQFVEEQLLICASDIIRAEQVCYGESYSTLTDIQQDYDFINEMEERIEQLSEQEEPSDKTNEDDIRLYFNSDFYDRLALALIGKELSVESGGEFYARRQELQLRVADYLRQILDGSIEPAFDVCYGYSKGLELSDETDQPLVTEPLSELHDVNSFAYVKYLDTNYLLYQQDDKVIVAKADTMTPVWFRAVSEGGMYAAAYAMRPEVDSPAHFVTLDWKQGLLQGWHLGQSLPVITLRLNAFKNNLPLELSFDGRILLIGITAELDEEANLNPDLFDIKTQGKDVVVAIDLTSGQELCRFEHPVEQTIKLSPNGDFALCAENIDLEPTDRFICVDLMTGSEKAISLPSSKPFHFSEFAISSDAQNVVYKQTVFELATGECICQLTGDDYVYGEIDDHVYEYEFSHCDDYVIAAINRDNVRDIFRVGTGERVARIYGDDPFNVPEISQNYLDSDNGIFYSFNDYSIYLYDLASELGLNRAPLEAPEDFGSVRISDSIIVPPISRRKGSFSNDEHGTELCILRFGVEGNSGELVEPKWYSPGESLPKIGVDFTMSARGIRTVQGFVIKLHHPEIDGKTQTQWQVIGQNGRTLMLRDPFEAQQRVEGLYEFEVYSLDEQLLLARQMIYVGVAQTQPCQIDVVSYGSFFGTHHPADKKAVINYDNTTIGFHLVAKCPEALKCVKLKSRIYREHGSENNDDLLFKPFSVEREMNIVDGQLIELVIFGKESNGYLEGDWCFELIDRFSEEILFSDKLTVYEQDHQHTENKVLKLGLAEYGIYDPGEGFDYRQRRVSEAEQAVLIEQTYDLPQQEPLMYGYKFRISDSSPDAVYRICVEQWTSGQKWIGLDDGNDRYKTYWTTIQKNELKMASWTIAAEHEIFTDMSRILVRHGLTDVSMMHDFIAKQEVSA